MKNRVSKKGFVLDKQYSYLFLLPGLVIFGIFYIYPVLSGVYYSFTYWNFRTARFCGLDNYTYILSQEYYHTALRNTLLFTVLSTTLGFLVSISLALFLMQKLKLKSYFRTVSYMPVIINSIAIGIAFTSILHPTNGFLNEFLRSINLEYLASDWIFDSRYSMITIVLIQTWRDAGFFALIFIAGLSAIGDAYYDAAKVDGANYMQTTMKITLPLLIPQINNVLVLLLVRGFKVFDMVMATTMGGPGHQTATLNSYAYDVLLSGRAGESSAAMVLLAILCGVIGIGLANFLRKKEVDL